MAMLNDNAPDATERMREMFGAGQVDQQVRQAIQLCWMLLPEDRKTVDELERQIQRIMNRALKDLRDDMDAFGLGVERRGTVQ